jgi:competence protein ComEC
MTIPKLFFLFLVLCLASGLFASASASEAASTTLTAAFIDVGQGDSIWLHDSNNYDILIDGGKTTAGPTVLAYLRAHSIDDIDLMIVTHPDSDHVGGLIDILDATDIPVEQVMYSGYPGDTATWTDFTNAVANEGLTLATAQYPSEYTWGSTTAQVLNPVSGLSNPPTNDASVVVRLTHGSIKFMLPGDISSTIESQILVRSTDLTAQILKVAHHGSEYSSSAPFLAAVDPLEAIISVGDNTYGHPNPDTISRLLAAGARIWRTDQCGTIVVVSDGASYSVNSECNYKIFLPLVVKQDATPPVTADLHITTLSGTTTPEYVIIENVGTGPQDLAGWTLVSVVGNQIFNFPSGFNLPAGSSVRIESYTGAVSNPPAVLFWSNSAIWANTGDKAELRNPSYEVVSSMCYGSGCP